MNSRDILKALGGVAAACAGAPFPPISAPPFRPGDGTLFNPRQNLADGTVRDRQTGISIRYLREWDITDSSHIRLTE